LDAARTPANWRFVFSVLRDTIDSSVNEGPVTRLQFAADNAAPTQQRCFCSGSTSEKRIKDNLTGATYCFNETAN
jgi:hypothetical protein